MRITARGSGPRWSVLLLVAIAGCDGTQVEGPLPDLVLANVMLSRTDLVTMETIDIVAEITNTGAGPTPATFAVRLGVVDGGALDAVTVPRLEPDSSATVEFRTGPFGEGRYTIELTVDPDDEIDEVQEGNNSVTRQIVVGVQRPIGLNSPVTVSSSTVNEVLLFRVDIREASDEALNVELSGGEGDADLFVHYGERPSHHYRYRCPSGNAASDEFCQLVPTRVGTYHIAVHAYTAFGPSRLEVTVGGREVEPYDVDLVFVEPGTSSQNQIVRQAAARWEAVIGRGAADFDYSANPAAAGSCGPGSPPVNDVIDDVRIYVTIDSIDGPGDSEGNIVGQAGPCAWRLAVFQAPGGASQDTIHREVLRGYIVLDEYDVDQLERQGLLQTVVTHEMAHVLGFGTLWDNHGRLRDPSLPDNPNADTHFEGPLTVAAFDNAGGSEYTGSKVPVENSGLEGSADGHWRESVMEDELMGPFLAFGAQPLSAITLESLYEIGYEINLREAESYAFSMGGVETPRGPVIDLRHDIGRIPMVGLDETGRVVKVIHPGGR